MHRTRTRHQGGQLKNRKHELSMRSHSSREVGAKRIASLRTKVNLQPRRLLRKSYQAHHDLSSGRAHTETVYPDDPPVQPDITKPRVRNTGLDGDPFPHALGTRIPCIRILPLEGLEARHRNDPRAGPSSWRPRARAAARCRWRGGSLERGRFLLRDVAALEHAFAARRHGISLSIGTAWRVSASSVGPSVCWKAAAKAPAVSSGSAGRITSRLGMTRRPRRSPRADGSGHPRPRPRSRA